MQDLELFLQQQTAEGEQQGQGAFTIDAARAWDLLAAQAQPFEQAWVLKLAQAACAARCTQFRVTQLADTTTFTFPGATWNWPELNAALGRLAEGSAGALDHLATALRWLARTVDRPFKLSLFDGQLVRWDGSTFVVEGAGGSGSGAEPWLCVEHQTAEQQASLLSRLTRPGVGFAASIAQVLHRRAYTSPVPPLLDGLCLAGLHRDSRFSGLNARPLILLSSPPRPPLEELPMLLVPDWAKVGTEIELRGVDPEPVSNSRHGIATLLVAYSMERAVSRGFVSSRRDGQRRDLPQARSSYLLWVLDGVVIEEEELPLGTAVGFAVALSAKGLRTDLSGFALVQDRLRSARRRAALEALHEQLDELCAQPCLQVDVERQGQFYLKVRAVSAIVSLLIVPPLGLLLGADAHKVYRQEAELESEMEDTYQRAIRQLRDQVAGLARREEYEV